MDFGSYTCLETNCKQNPSTRASPDWPRCVSNLKVFTLSSRAFVAILLPEPLSDIFLRSRSKGKTAPKFAIDIPAEASAVETLKSIVNTLEEGKNHIHYLRNKVYEYYTTVGLCQLGVDRKQREEDEQRETKEGPEAGDM